MFDRLLFIVFASNTALGLDCLIRGLGNPLILIFLICLQIRLASNIIKDHQRNE